MKKFLLSIFAVMLAVFSVQAEEVTVVFDSSTQGYTNSQLITSATIADGITVSFDKGSASTATAYYTSGTAIRCYAKSTFTVESSIGTIAKIEFTYGSGDGTNGITSSVGTFDENTWTGESNSITFTIGGTSKHRRIQKIAVTYTTAGDGEVSKPVTPTLTAAGNFVGSMWVEISCATDGAEIYYTTDGTEPTEDSEAYIEPFEITETTTVKAIAINETGESNVATAVYTRVAATPEITFDGEATFEESVEVTIVAAEGTTVYYTLNGKTPTEDSDVCPETLTIKADATLQVIAYDEDGYASPVAKQAFKKATSGSEGAATGTATLVEDAADLAVGDQVVIVAAGYDYALSTTQNSNNRARTGVTKNDKNVAYGDDVQVLTIENGTVDGTFAFNTGAGYLYAASSSSNYLRTQTANNANGSWSVEIADGKAAITAKGTNTRNQIRYNNSNSIFSCYGSGQQDVSIYKVNLSTVEDYVLNVTEAGWATLYLGYNVVVPEDVVCYAISGVEGTSVILDEVTGVLPANTAVIVEAEEGEYTFEVTENNADVESLMAGTTKAEYKDVEAYVLSIVDGEVGLYKAAMNGGVWLNNANKAYLPVSALPKDAQGAASFSFRFEGGTTGVEEVKTENGEVKAIYDLTGRQVNAVERGIYIINGKKVLVK